MGTKINVVYSLSRNLYPWLRPSVTSLLEHNRDVKIYVFAEDDELPFEIPCEHEILNLSGQDFFPPDGPNMRSQFTYMAMLRVCTPILLTETRAIQLDVDTIVCDSLAPIWETDLEGKWLAWAPETYGQWKPFGPDYYNFGVAVLNLRQLRIDRATDYMVKALNCIQVPFIDQDIMNMFAVPEKSVRMPARFNECFCCGQSGNPAIVHYAGFPDWMTDPATPRREYLERYLEA